MEELGEPADLPADYYVAVRWVSSHWEEEGGVQLLFEVNADGAVIRQIEFTGPDAVPTAAASMGEFWAAQGNRRRAATAALEAYQAHYGRCAEGKESDWGDYPHDVITADEFETAWQRARSALEPV